MKILTLLQSRTVVVSAAIISTIAVTCIAGVPSWLERSVWVVAFLIATH